MVETQQVNAYINRGDHPMTNAGLETDKQIISAKEKGKNPMGKESKSTLNAGNLAAKIRARQAATVAHPARRTSMASPLCLLATR